MVRGIHHDWKLPSAPDPDDGWLPIVRLGWAVPFGYEKDPDNPLILNPIPKQLELWEEVKKHVKKYSYKEVWEWFRYHSDHNLSFEGFKQRLAREAKHQKDIAGYEYWAKKYKEAARLSKKIQENRLGRHKDKGVEYSCPFCDNEGDSPGGKEEA